MARNASRLLIGGLLLVVVGCGEDFVPPEPIPLTTAERLGVPKGADIFQEEDDVAEFDVHVNRYADMSCRTLSSTIAALQVSNGNTTSTSRRIARVGGSIIPGPAGNLARATIGELASASAERGDTRISAAEAVRVAKDC